MNVRIFTSLMAIFSMRMRRLIISVSFSSSKSLSQLRIRSILLFQVIFHPFYQPIKGYFCRIGNKRKDGILQIMIDAFNTCSLRLYPSAFVRDRSSHRYRVKNKFVQNCRPFPLARVSGRSQFRRSRDDQAWPGINSFTSFSPTLNAVRMQPVPMRQQPLRH